MARSELIDPKRGIFLLFLNYANFYSFYFIWDIKKEIFLVSW
jgi:hypothetical protein